MDKLIVHGFGRNIDGEYECDPRAMASPGGPLALTGREGEYVKRLCGVRQAEMWDALAALDGMLYLALGAVVLARLGKRVDDDKLSDALPVMTLTGEEEDLSALLEAKKPFFQFAFEPANREEDEEDPPELPAETPETQSPSGGQSSRPTLVHPANDPSPTGPPDSETSAVSAHGT